MLEKFRLGIMSSDRKSLLFSVMLFAVLAAAPFFWAAANESCAYIGGGDNFSPIDIETKLENAFYPFNHFSFAGWYDIGSLSAIPTFVFFKLFQAVGVSPLGTTLLFIGLIIFVGQMSFYLFVRYILDEKMGMDRDGHQILMVCGAVLYGFSPYMTALIIPGHFYNLIVYAAFPLIILELDVLLVSEGFNFRTCLRIFLIFLACAPGISIATVYVLLIACLIYTVSMLSMTGLNLGAAFTRFSGFVSLIFLSNTWFLLPYLQKLQHLIAVGKGSASTITANVSHASSLASVLNIFLGKPQSLMYMKEVVGNDYYVSGPILLIFSAFLAAFLGGLFSKRKYLYVLLSAVLMSLFFVKGVQAPLSDFFLWAYNHIPGFKILRRPDSKFYGFFILFYWSAAVTSVVLLFHRYARNSRWKSILFRASGIAAAGYLVVIFVLTSGLIPFNIPQIYKDVNDYLVKEKVERLFILPGTFGLNPVYTSAVNSYNGIDFLNDLFAFPVIAPDSSDYSANELYKGRANQLMKLIREDQSICGTAASLGISHILVRQDTVPSMALEDSPERIISVLDKAPDIQKKKVFKGPGTLSVYTLKDRCQSKLLSVGSKGSGFDSFSFKILSPTEIRMQFKGVENPLDLTFLTNFDSNWRIYPVEDRMSADGGNHLGFSEQVARRSYEKGFFGYMGAVQYLTRPPAFYHSVFQGYANQWQIDSDTVKRLPEEFYTSNDDGSVNFSAVLFYGTQAFVPLGAIISFATFALLLLLSWRKGKDASVQSKQG